MNMGWTRALAPSLVAAGILLVLPLNGCGPSKASNAPVTPPPQATAPPLPPPGPQPQPPPAPTANDAQAALKKLRVGQVIEQVEAIYAAGDADYQRGMLPEAKVQFDHAVDLMLSCGVDIESDPALNTEFEKIVDKVNALEMEALKQGNGFVPNEELTPAEAASDVTFGANPNVEAKAQADLATTHSDLPLMVNEYVASFINFFAYTQKGHNTLLHAFERAGHYRGMIQRILAEEGLPQDLIYLAVAESGFQPRAIDRRSGAGGMWQFMPHGDYGLTRNRYVDQRFDPEESTLAYARYMRFLYDQLGDWYLAMAAYDWGAGNVQRAVEKTGYADFWQLYQRHELPGETQNYVPEILAAIIIANHPAQYGFDDITLDPPVLTDTVTVNYSIDLRLVSDLVGVPVDELVALNPSLLHMVTPPDISFDLHLPAGTATVFDQRVALIPEDKRNAWRYHVMAPGDTLESVAREFHVREAALA
jgi:membrane-bound lytic murein transglycosylase D